MNVSSSTSSSANALWSLLASRAAAASKSSYTTTADSDESSTTSATSTRPEGPPPPPSQFDCAMSTSQFAGMAPMGPPPGGDPSASLDADDSGSVSAEEFGLNEDSDDKLQALFSAIDGDGSGELSTDEIDSFREQMMAADSGHPPGPPPDTAQAMPDVSAFLKQLAERYASLASTSTASISVSATA